MKKLIIILAAAAMTGCGIYKPYTRPEVKTDGLYGTAETADTMTIGNIGWEEMFSDPYLQTLIRQGLENNTDLQSAQWRVKEAEATLKSARLAYLPSFNFAPQGNLSSFDWATPSKTYNIPVTASWQIDIFNGLTNAKRKAKALYAQSREYEQAVKTQLISGIANLYYTLLMLDGQYEVTEQMRFMIQGLGYSRLAIIAGVCEMAARSFVGFCLVPVFGYIAVCIASPVAWIAADLFLIPAYRHVMKNLNHLFYGRSRATATDTAE